MMKIVSKLILAMALLWQTSCAFISMEDYYRPDYTGKYGRLARIDCCDGSGPEAVLVVDAPKGVQFTMIMWNGEVGNKHRMIKGKKGNCPAAKSESKSLHSIGQGYPFLI